MHPAEEKSPSGPEAAPQVGVLAARFWNRGAQLREGKRAEDGENRSHDPRGEYDGDAAAFTRHFRRLQENSRADHGANHDRHGSPGSQAAHKFKPFLAHDPPLSRLACKCSPTGSAIRQEVAVRCTNRRLIAAPSANVTHEPISTYQVNAIFV